MQCLVGLTLSVGQGRGVGLAGALAAGAALVAGRLGGTAGGTGGCGLDWGPAPLRTTAHLCLLVLLLFPILFILHSGVRVERGVTWRGG